VSGRADIKKDEEEGGYGYEYAANHRGSGGMGRHRLHGNGSYGVPSWVKTVISVGKEIFDSSCKSGWSVPSRVGQAMSNATQMSGAGGCFLSFHTFKLPLVGDTGVPDRAYATGCH
jgi:hypothetical protein